MPDLSVDTMLEILALLASLGALMWVSARLECRKAHQIAEAQRLADEARAEEYAKLLANAKAIMAKVPTPHPGESVDAFRHRQGLTNRLRTAIQKHGPYVIAPASMSEPTHTPSISTTDSDDRAAAVISTLTLPMPTHSTAKEQ